LNVLPPELASGLLRSLLLEATAWKANRFRLFERVVQTKSSSCLYVDRMDPLSAKEYVYNGSKVSPSLTVFLSPSGVGVLSLLGLGCLVRVWV